MKRLILLLALASITPLVQADEIFDAILLPGNEVPPHSDDAIGAILVDLHSDLLTLDVQEIFFGLAAPASAAHIHCCAPEGVNAPVALPFTGFPTATSGMYMRTFNLATDLMGGITPAAFIAGLESGNTYANIHDSKYPGGDIRGQLTRVPEPGILSMFGGLLTFVVFFRRRLA